MIVKTTVMKKYEGKWHNALMTPSPAFIEESVSDRNYDKNEKYDEERESEGTDETSSIEAEEVVSDRNDDKNEEIDEEKEAECLDDTSPDDMEEGESDKKNYRSKKWRGNRGWMPRSHFPWKYGGMSKWYKLWKKMKKIQVKEAECIYENFPDEME